MKKLVVALGLTAPAALAEPKVPVQVAPVIPVTAASPVPASAPETKTNLGFRVDCVHDFNLDKGAAQNCLSVSGLRFNVQHQQADKVRGMIQLDPFGTPRISRRNTPSLENTPEARDSALGIVDDFSVIWQPRPNLEVAVEDYEGAAHMPSTSGLAMGGFFDETGWKQTALTVTYNLAVPAEMRVRFAAGNGEGETVGNLDPQQYFGFDLDAKVGKGVHVNFGVSLDGNDVGSEEYDYLANKYLEDEGCAIDLSKTQAKLGHSTQRLAGGVSLDGTTTGVEGLKLGLGWQRSVMSDLDKKRRSAPTETDLAKCRRIDVDTVFVEDSGEAVNTVQRTVYGFNVNYRLFTSYFVAFDYETRRIDTGSVKLFEVCKGYTDGVCTAATGDRRNKIQQDVFAVGGGLDLEKDLRLTVEYAKESFDKQYSQVFFYNQDGKVSESRELFNARLAYNFN